MDNDKRHQLFRDLGKYFQSVGIVVLGFFGYLIKLNLENNTNELDFYMPVIGITALIFLALPPILLIFGAKEPKKDE